uniref:Uncharacterized protein n=1 Tax=Ixodes ricinus TaxID=34613 RepID=A0A6B0U1A1_IXORI
MSSSSAMTASWLPSVFGAGLEFSWDLDAAWDEMRSMSLSCFCRFFFITEKASLFPVFPISKMVLGGLNLFIPRKSLALTSSSADLALNTG